MPYVYTQVSSLQGRPWVDGGNSVLLVKEYAPGLKDRSTQSWREGVRVMEARNLARGTAIATFEKGKYPGRDAGQVTHAAFFLWHVQGGIYVMDQFTSSNRAEKIIASRFVRSLGKNRDGTYVKPSNNADAFSVIE